MVTMVVSHTLYLFVSWLCFVNANTNSQSNQIEDNNNNAATTTLHTSCIGLPDGYHYIKPLPDDNGLRYPIVHVLCSNEYVIIDNKLEPEWDAYFTTWIKYHYGVVGPVRNDHSNWSQWFLPDRVNQANSGSTTRITGKYIVSPECDVCDISSTLQLHADATAYYMSALAFGCFNPVRGWPACDFDYESYECRICAWDDKKEQISSSHRDEHLTWELAVANEIKTGVCNFEIRSSVESISQSYTKCAAQGEVNRNWKPSLGIDGRFCQCYQPAAHPYEEHPVLSAQELLTVEQSRLDDKIERVLAAQSNPVRDPDELLDITTLKEYHLYQADFVAGTYRIAVPGTYIIMEDIEFDFNAPPKAPFSSFSPNNVEDNWWWPHVEDSDLYPGAGGSRDAFFLGFFAGITIECDNVILDLNGHELRMSRSFYYQQPFFSVIELASQPFLPQQGPGMFGADPHFATNIVIKNGVIGLSSHHGIHGNHNNGITIQDIHVQNFQTHGIQINGFDGIEIVNVEIGPSSQRVYLNGNYGQMRLLLPTLSKIADERQDERIQFNGRENGVTMHELIEKLVHMMDMVLSYVMDGETSEHDEDWEDAVRLFVNPSGLPLGAALYGLYLNYPSAGIFGWHVNDKTSTNAKLENVHIHDLRHKGIEVVGFSQGGRVICNAFNGPLPATDIFDSEQLVHFQHMLYSDNIREEDAVYAQYQGSIVTDVHIAMYHFGKDNFDNWPGIPFYGYGNKMVDWAMGKMPKLVSSQTREDFNFYCNEDAMFHPAKGLLGLKLSGIDGIDMKNIQIDRLQDETPIGSMLCGTQPKFGLYHFAQQAPYQIGYSMNMVMALTMDFTNARIEDLYINDVYSSTGLAFGMAAWFESDLDMHGKLEINNLNAGGQAEDADTDSPTYNDLPNRAAEACAIRLFDDSEEYVLNIDWNLDDSDVQQTCVNGQVGCFGQVGYSHFGDADNTQCDFDSAPLPFAPDTFDDLLQSEDSLIPKPRPPPRDESQTEKGDSYWMNKERMHGYNGAFMIVVVTAAILITVLCVIKMVFVTDKQSRKNQSEYVQNVSESTHLLSKT